MGAKLTEFGPEIWGMDGDIVRMYGIPFSTRMVIVRLEDGGLWVHSPIAPTPARCAAIDGLGPVHYVVAPNKLHSVNIEAWHDQYPDAQVWVSPGFHDRHPTIAANGYITDKMHLPWGDELQHCVLAGHSILDEVIFFHPISRSLIVTDVIQKHVPENDIWFWRWIKQLAGVLGRKGGVALDMRMSFKDKDAARQSVRRILAWDFDQLILSHGICIRQCGKAHVEKAFDWLLK